MLIDGFHNLVSNLRSCLNENTACVTAVDLSLNQLGRIQAPAAALLIALGQFDEMADRDWMKSVSTPIMSVE